MIIRSGLTPIKKVSLEADVFQHPEHMQTEIQPLSTLATAPATEETAIKPKAKRHAIPTSPFKPIIQEPTPTLEQKGVSDLGAKESGEMSEVAKGSEEEQG